MAVVHVNGKPVDIGNERLNLIQAAQRGGVFVPSYCWHPALTVVASCRMCLVEVGERKPDGTVAMQPKVVPACQTPACRTSNMIRPPDGPPASIRIARQSATSSHRAIAFRGSTAGSCLSYLQSRTDLSG